jgi:DNA-binding response OmpR family regulator
MANILLIDDDKVIQISVSAALTNAGHTVAIAHNGHDGISMAGLELFDLIITDVNMPGGVSGFNLVSTLRKTDRYQSVPILVLSGRRDKKDIETALVAGANDYVIKPVDFDVFLNKIDTLLQEKYIQHKFADILVKKSATWKLDFEVKSVSQQSIYVLSPVKIPVNIKLHIESQLFNEIKIEPPLLRVAACNDYLKEPGKYKLQLHFVGLTEEEMQKIRKWIFAQPKNSKVA